MIARHDSIAHLLTNALNIGDLQPRLSPVGTPNVLPAILRHSLHAPAGATDNGLGPIHGAGRELNYIRSVPPDAIDSLASSTCHASARSNS